MMEVNPNTAFRAYDYLQSKEILYNKRGIGYFVAQNGYEKTIEFKKNEFLEVDVPQFFKTMKLLGLSYKDLEDYMKKTIFKNL
jgi:GntR family transcriptional regulator